MSTWTGALVRKARAALRPMLPLPCPRCGQPIYVDQAWDVGHIISRDIAPELIADPSNWRAEHSHCNRAAGARYRNAKHAKKRRYTSRNW